VRFTALLHHITVDHLTRSYLALERDSAPGIDGVTWQAYGENLKENLTDLHDRIHRGSYRARPARRTYIPKADGSRGELDKAIKTAESGGKGAYIEVMADKYAASPLAQKLHDSIATLYASPVG
jgi:hypothetical protein